jgi:hypothetical protein
MGNSNNVDPNNQYFLYATGVDPHLIQLITVARQRDITEAASETLRQNGKKQLP